MKVKSCVSVLSIARVLSVASVAVLAACAGTNNNGNMIYDTPTVDYVEGLDVYSAPHQDSFLNQLAMNYRSYAVYNARTSGYSDVGELFANKAVAAFSGETPFPETLGNWPISDEQEAYDLNTAYNDIIEQFRNDATFDNPQLAAEVQAKFDCWLSASATGQYETADQCRDRYYKAMNALRDCIGGKIVSVKNKPAVVENVAPVKMVEQQYYPETRTMAAMQATSRARDGVIIVNNVTVPEHLINPVPVQPMVFNQNIYGGDKTVTKTNMADCSDDTAPCDEVDSVSRSEFVDMMMQMRSELAAINARLDKIEAMSGDKTMIKVQQIPLEPQQHVMEEVFEVRFDFDKSAIKPEYQALIKQLAAATQENRNIKVSVVGHTDTMGSKSYNYALGGRRAEAVQKMLIEYGIPASQIVAVSAGEEDLKVPTPDGVANAANRRVRVVKEVHYTEKPRVAPIAVQVEEVSSGRCGEYGCNK